MTEEIVHNLEKLGFSNHESRVFCVLFEGHLVTASYISKKAGIPRSSTYDILRTFVKKGICNEIQTSSVAKYEIIDPAIVQDKIEKEIADYAKNRISSLKESFEKLQPFFKSNEFEGQKVDVELIKGFNKHRNSKFMEILRTAEKEVLLMTRLESNINTEADELTINFIKNGGVLKTLYEAGNDFKIKIDGKWQTVTKDIFPGFIDKLAFEGEEIRLADKINQNMLVVDRRIVFVSLVDETIPRYNRSDVIIKNENFAATMAEYFGTAWDKAFTPSQYKKRITQQEVE